MPNRLIHEKSPYLLQHAHNPVDWYPWADEAFARARTENKPVFLSIGYATCHWCHVMERESFEDEEVAQRLNEVFISIKVDREERPDVDALYMTACQLLTGHGGWPLTVFLLPDQRPFFVATYLPKHTRHGRLGLLDLITRIEQLWATEQTALTASAGEITSTLQRALTRTPDDTPLPDNLAHQAVAQFAQRFDKTYGGFGHQPKFPTPHNLMFLLRYWKRTQSEDALHMVTHTLRHMRRGGLFDQVGFGFHRYATDAEWLLPHFEKMLYD